MDRTDILHRYLDEPDFVFKQFLPEREVAYRECTVPNRHSQQFSREMAIKRQLCDAGLEHLGYGPVPDILMHLNRGVDYALDYYLGDWWKQTPDPEFVKRYPNDWRDEVEADARRMDKNHPERELA